MEILIKSTTNYKIGKGIERNCKKHELIDEIMKSDL